MLSHPWQAVVSSTRTSVGEKRDSSANTRKRFPMSKPDVLAEQEHAEPGQSRIQQGQPARLLSTAASSKTSSTHAKVKQHHARPYAKCSWILPVARQFVAAWRGDRFFHPLIDGSQRVDDGPQVAEQGGKVGQADPPDDPDQRRRRFRVGLAVPKRPATISSTYRPTATNRIASALPMRQHRCGRHCRRFTRG